MKPHFRERAFANLKKKKKQENRKTKTQEKHNNPRFKELFKCNILQL